MAAVAGIVDANGGLRIVVSEYDHLGHHIQDGEKIYVLPFEVNDPVSWGEIPALIANVEDYVRSQQ